MPGFESLSLVTLGWIVAVMLAAGVIQGALGLGFPTVATPLIALATDIWTAVVLVLLPCLATIVTSMVVNPDFRRALAQYWTMPIFVFAGAAVGARLFITFPGFPYALLLAGVIIVYLNLDRLRREWPLVRAHPRATGALFGVAAGFTEGTANVAAPALIAYFLALGLQPTIMIQAMLLCFFTGKTTQFATFAAAGAVTPVQWLVTLPLAVLAAVATVHGIRIRGSIDAQTYRRWLRGALWTVAAILLGQFAWEAAAP